ncbi:MAG: outer membrane protein transport protein [Acidobacteriia bacterium]|nr:outer membrane protein transport protein [Terriglobia bacterium]
MKTGISSSLLAVVLTLLTALPGAATDGYFATGYGVKQQGAGGAGVALGGDSLAAATNPAGMFFAGDRFDLGVSFFQPVRGATISGNLFPVNGDYDGSGRKNFLIPELGYNRRVRSRFSLCISVFGNGGMNTTYFGGIPLFGSGRAGVNLEQLFVAPTLAFKLSKRNVFGVSLNLAYQRFQLEGLQNFASAAYSIDPANVTNRGTDSAFGAGVRVGWIGAVSRSLSLGATVQSRTHMGKFNRYRGLFAEQGGFDIPANFAGGVALKIRSRATLAFDAERILYSQVKSIANSGTNQALLGSDNGPGFGWRDITAYKLGGSYRVNSSLTLRAGYNHSGQPFAATETFFNVLAPGVVKNHVTAGATVRLQGGREINFFYLHAFTGSVAGVNSIPAGAGGGNASLRMHQNSAGISLGWNKE